MRENLVIREKFDYHLDDSVDISKFVKKLQEKYSFGDDVRENIENSISFQVGTVNVTIIRLYLMLKK